MTKFVCLLLFFSFLFLPGSLKVPVLLHPSLSDEVPILFSEVDEDGDDERNPTPSDEEPDGDSLPRM